MTLWGGRFAGSPDPSLWRFTVDTSDRRLLVDDVGGSLAHVGMLGETGLVTPAEATGMTEGLEAILREAEAGEFTFAEDDEDVHTAVERRLGELIGETAGKLHTGRSRNDQVCLDLRLYLRRATADRIDQIRGFVAALVGTAERVDGVVVPGYTHLQQGQAIPLAHHLLAHAWVLIRDIERFDSGRARIDVSPLGAGALGGSSLPLDPAAVAHRLGFAGVFSNSLDAVGSRDFVSEYVFCCAQTMTNLSRFAEELILWATAEFGWVTFSDEHTTGSSALPHKKNPDIAELVRGRTATVLGDLTAVLALQKALPLAYNRDLQEDKRVVFHADDTLGSALEALTAMVAGARFHPPAPSSWVTALDLAETLVERGVPFRQAHEAVGALVLHLVADGRTLDDLTGLDLVAAHPLFQPADRQRIDPATSVSRRATPGGGSFASVRGQVAAIRDLLHLRAGGGGSGTTGL